MDAVLMTSFFESKKLNLPLFSAAVYQPRGFSYPKICWTDIRDESGNWIRPREFLSFLDPAQAYWNAMLDHYDSRLDKALKWKTENQDLDTAALCCWCPFDRAAQRQLKEFGSFICHTGPLGHWIETRLEIPVFYDFDRLRMYRGEETNTATAAPVAFTLSET